MKSSTAMANSLSALRLRSEDEFQRVLATEGRPAEQLATGVQGEAKWTLGLQISQADRDMILRCFEDRKPAIRVFQAVEGSNFEIELKEIL